MSEIRGSTAKIKSTATSIRDDAKSYGVAMRALFDEVESLSGSFISEDGTAYIRKITSFKGEFEAMQKKLEESASALEAAAIGYENTIKSNMV